MTPDIQSEVAGDLNYLEAHGALAGVAGVIRERRRQIEQLGYTAEHDGAEHADGSLVHRSAVQLGFAEFERVQGVADPASDEDRLRKAGALAAAEIDRLSRLLAPGDPRGEEQS